MNPCHDTCSTCVRRYFCRDTIVYSQRVIARNATTGDAILGESRGRAPAMFRRTFPPTVCETEAGGELSAGEVPSAAREAAAMQGAKRGVPCSLRQS